jgi:hypothetical protein
MNDYDKELIKICMEVKNRRGFKVYKLIYFSYNLLSKKKIRRMDMLKNYLMVYYKPANDTLQTALNILKKYDLIKITRNLSDCRSYLVFPKNV